MATITMVLFAGQIVRAADSCAVRKWDKRQHVKYERWERLRPKHANVQYAGGMGFLSFGTGWEYGKRNQWETDICVGFLPKAYADQFHLIFTLKQNYIPWSIQCNRWLSVEPFACGLYFTTINGEDFWGKEPGRYPNGYYNFSSKIRTSIYVGQRFSFHTRNETWQRISLFYELGTNELYIISKATNKTLKMKDILRISFGASIGFYKP